MDRKKICYLYFMEIYAQATNGDATNELEMKMIKGFFMRLNEFYIFKLKNFNSYAISKSEK